MPQNRIAWIDKARGGAIFAMIIYHAGFDLINIFGLSIPILESPIVELVLHPIFAGLFIFLSGVSCRLSRNNLKRGTFLLIISSALSIITYFFMPVFFISFGILHLLTACILFFCLCQKLFNKFKNNFQSKIQRFQWGIVSGTRRLRAGGHLVLVISFIFLFIIIRAVFLSFPALNISGTLGLLLFILGVPVRGFYSADYFPILPWSMAFFAGACSWPALSKHKSDDIILEKKKQFSLLESAGKHTLLIYILHQPILIFIFSVAFA